MKSINTFKYLTFALICSSVLLTNAETAPTAKAAGYQNRYAAIAWSTSTRRFGYAYNHTSLAAAKAAALRQCYAWDARIVVWSRNGWVALARGYGGSVGWAHASTAARARELALVNCLRYSSYARIRVSVPARK